MAGWSDSSEGNEYEKPEAGSQVARCIEIFDIGTQTGEYEGKKTVRRQNILVWELVDAKDTQGENFTVKKFYTASLNENAALRKDLQAWRGRAFSEEELKNFEQKNILGAACMLSLQKNAKGKIVVVAVMAVPKGMVVPPATNPQWIFSLNQDEFTLEKFNMVPEWIKRFIVLSPEYDKRFTELHGRSSILPVVADLPLTDDVDGDNLPF